MVVNIPAAQIEAVENDAVVSRHAGVVGKPDRPTPMLKSAIHELNFNAVWHLPPTVIEKDLIPKGREMARRGQSVLVKFGIDAYGGDGKKLDPTKVNWTLAERQGPDLQAAARTRKPARLREDQLHQRAFRLHARHALRNRCSGAISALPARDACACTASRSWPRGWWPGRAGGPSTSSR